MICFLLILGLTSALGVSLALQILHVPVPAKMVSIFDESPPDFRYILVFGREGTGQPLATYFGMFLAVGDNRYFVDAESGNRIEVTHWRPIVSQKDTNSR